MSTTSFSPRDGHVVATRPDTSTADVYAIVAQAGAAADVVRPPPGDAA